MIAVAGYLTYYFLLYGPIQSRLFYYMDRPNIWLIRKLISMKFNQVIREDSRGVKAALPAIWLKRFLAKYILPCEWKSSLYCIIYVITFMIQLSETL